jgi:hypothetical protein
VSSVSSVVLFPVWVWLRQVRIEHKPSEMITDNNETLVRAIYKAKSRTSRGAEFTSTWD